MSETVRFITTVAVIIIFMSLSWVYRTSFKKNLRENKINSSLLGIIIALLSLLFALWLMKS